MNTRKSIYVMSFVNYLIHTSVSKRSVMLNLTVTSLKIHGVDSEKDTSGQCEVSFLRGRKNTD